MANTGASLAGFHGKLSSSSVDTILGADLDATKLKSMARTLITNGDSAFWFSAEGGRTYYADLFPGVVSGGSDVSVAVQAIIDGVLVAGDTLVFGGDIYGYSHIRINKAADPTKRAICFRGKGAATGQTYFRNVGTDPDLPMLSVAADRCLFVNIAFLGGYAANSCLCLVDVGGITNNSAGVNFNHFYNCTFDAGSQPRANWGAAALLTISGHRSYVVNDTGVQCESTIFVKADFLLRGEVESAVRIGYAAQPYCTTFTTDCAFYGGSASGPWGRAVFNENNSASLLFAAMVEFQQLEDCFVLTGKCPTYVAGIQSEDNKRLCTVNSAGSCTVLVDGGRWNMGLLEAETAGPGVYASANKIFASVQGRNTLIVRGLDTGGTGLAVRGARIYLDTLASLEWTGGSWPDTEMVLRPFGQEPADTAYTRITTQYYGQADGYGRVYESGEECENDAGSVGIYGTQTEVTVPLPRYEHGENYVVDVTPLEVIGSPAAGAERIRGIPVSNRSVKFSAEAAPGAGAGVRFAYRLRRGPALVVTDPTDIRACVLHLDASGMVASGGVITSWVDNVSARSFTPTGTVEHTVADADLGGLDSVTLGSGDLLVSDELAASWAFASNGTDGFFVYAVFQSTDASVVSSIYTAPGVGTGFRLTTETGGRLWLSKSDGIVGSYFVHTPPTTRRWVAGGFQGAKGLGTELPKTFLRASGPDSSRNVYTATSEIATAVSGIAPENTLTIGGSATLVKYAEIGIYSRCPSTYEQEALIAMIERKYLGFAQS